MRKLTIKRTKSFVGCLGVMKVYIESADGDTRIDDVLCKKLGDLKNGEEVCFDIGNEGAKIFVIADKLSKGFCNEFYQLEEGEEDIYLTGKNHLNPAAGNAFRFDNNDSQEVNSKRKKSITQGIIVFICVILAGGLFGYGIASTVFDIIGAQEESFRADEMTITLTKRFNEQAAYGYAGAFISNDVEILVLKERFVHMSSSKASAEEYAEKILAYNKFEYEKITNDDLTSYEYTNTAKDGTPYEYHLYCFKTDDAYWQVYFAVKESKAEKYRDDVIKWAKSIEID